MKNEERKEALIIDHKCTDISRIPAESVEKARKQYRVWYGHTSHGSQITGSMEAMNNSPFNFNENGDGEALSYQEITGIDLGKKGSTAWADKTREQLRKPDNDRNLVMWSWCGGVSGNTEEGINTYLDTMNQLEKEFPNVVFVCMTGHLDGTGVDGNLNKRNEQIRNYCRQNNKILFDFADIESYDPDGNYFLNLGADDECNYTDKDGQKRNWAREWTEGNPEHGIAMPQSAAHTHPLNGAMKGRAFWWMMARLAGWKG